MTEKEDFLFAYRPALRMFPDASPEHPLQPVCVEIELPAIYQQATQILVVSRCRRTAVHRSHWHNASCFRGKSNLGTDRQNQDERLEHFTTRLR